jgi:hypothetical protein
MTLWHASYEIRLTASGLDAAAVAQSLRLEVEAGREVAKAGLALNYRGTWDTSG